MEWIVHSIFFLESSVSFLSVKIWMEGTYDMPYKNNFFVTTRPNRIGDFAEMQIISYNFIILKHIFRSIHNFERYWCWKSDYHFFGTICIANPWFSWCIVYDCNTRSIPNNSTCCKLRLVFSNIPQHKLRSLQRRRRKFIHWGGTRIFSNFLN